MGAQPKKKITRARQGKKRNTINLKSMQLTKCPNCGGPKRPHQACQNCGIYKNLAVGKKEEVKVKRVEEK